MDVSLAPQAITNIGGVAISNSLITALFMTALFAVLGLYATRSFSVVPTRLQVALELISNFLIEQLNAAFGSKARARQFFPFIMTLLLFLLVANQLTVVPIVGQAVINGQPLFRTVTAHLTATVALAVLTLACAHGVALYLSPVKHIGNYIKIAPFFKVRSFGDFGNAFLELFLGILDIISELAKLLSLSFRLFGNIFAGELMIVVIAGLSAYTKLLVPVPFLALSIFSGLVQAVVFTMLSIQFIAGTISSVSEPPERTGGGVSLEGKSI